MTDQPIRESVLHELAETHGNAAYLADNLAAVRAELDQAEADVDRLRGELDAIGDLAYRFGRYDDPQWVRDFCADIHTRAKRAAKGETDRG